MANKFKYFMHESQDWPKQSIKWEDIKPESYETQVKDFDSVLEYLKDEWWVYDCDGGHTYTYYLAVDSGEEVRYYLVTHDFSAYYSEEGFTVDNYFEISRITKEQAHIPDDRDWLNISEYNYNLKKWPPNDR
jgi:hypothetical protein